MVESAILSWPGGAAREPGDAQQLVCIMGLHSVRALVYQFPWLGAGGGRLKVKPELNPTLPHALDRGYSLVSHVRDVLRLLYGPYKCLAGNLK